MCGIIVYIGAPVPGAEILRLGVGNRHRGCDDGFGLVDLETGEITKSLLSLEQLGKELEEDPGKASRRLPILEQTSARWLLHHRQSLGLLSQARILNRHRRLVGEETNDALVVRAKPTRLVREV